MQINQGWALLFKEVCQSVIAYGPDKVASYLHGIRVGEFEFNNEDVKHVVTRVADAFQLSVHEVMVGSGRKNERVFALGFCAYYLRYHYGYDIDDVRIVLYLQERSCYVYSNKILRLHPSNVYDRRFLQIKASLDKEMPPLKGELFEQETPGGDQ